MNKASNFISEEEARSLKDSFFGQIFPGAEVCAYHLRYFVAVDEITAVIDMLEQTYAVVRVSRHATRGTRFFLALADEVPDEIADFPAEFMMSTSGDVLKNDRCPEFTSITLQDLNCAIFDEVEARKVKTCQTGTR